MLRLESDLRVARQVGDAAENRVTAAQKDLRNMSVLEEEVRRLRSQLQKADKRLARESKALKDAEARGATAETRLAERDSHMDSLQQQLSTVRRLRPALPGRREHERLIADCGTAVGG